jgi:hypothetical protein
MAEISSFYGRPLDCRVKPGNDDIEEFGPYVESTTPGIRRAVLQLGSYDLVAGAAPRAQGARCRPVERLSAIFWKREATEGFRSLD